MRIEKVDGINEKTIITSMIVNTEILSNVYSKWEKGGLFTSLWANLIGDWCIRFYKRYGKAPKSSIESIFKTWADRNKSDKATIELVETYLASLSGNYEKVKSKINVPYTIDLAGECFNRAKIIKLKDALDSDLDIGKLEDVYKRIENFNKIEIGVGAGIDLFQDKEAIRSAFRYKRESIIKYPGALGKFLGDNLEKEGFISFMAPEKRGKTYWLMDFAWAGLLQRKKVAFFGVGDMTQIQTIHRFGIRAACIPMYPTLPGEPLIIPTAIEIKGKNAEITSYKEKKFNKGITEDDALYHMERIMSEKVKSDNSYFKLSIHPTSSISVSGIRSVLNGWARQNWIPDIVIIDYADILAMPSGFIGESRDGVNENWKAMRRMSQELHCLVVTATQAKATSYETESLGMRDFSEDKRKYAHVTGMIGINQTDEEKTKEIQRLNWIVLRESRYIQTHHVFVAGCLGIGRPAIVSAME